MDIVTHGLLGSVVGQQTSRDVSEQGVLVGHGRDGLALRLVGPGRVVVDLS